MSAVRFLIVDIHTAASARVVDKANYLEIAWRKQEQDRDRRIIVDTHTDSVMPRRPQ